MPTIALALNYWLHLLATVLWLGGLAMLLLVAWPSLRPLSDADPAGESRLFEALERRFRPFANISLLVLIVTGIIQMGGDPHYEGFLRFDTPWTLTLLAKHVIIGGMVIVTALLQWVVYPALERARLLARRDVADGRVLEATARRRLQRLAAANLGLGVIVLLLTAYLTAL